MRDLPEAFEWHYPMTPATDVAGVLAAFATVQIAVWLVRIAG
ncbi:hypothetical protein P775_26895 [Puniceibacterium antarcticum]|uniref:Uncharacterized protein n=1 Tax=Puniceibacterium antarcticum TaxID=1206336 RepID=A0A2G8QYG6_9RHOB|nr:hypothetical protein [Puniceibacterium antarcticum]PIL14336.1 hypothetical protein P775_26895 [Puniceibacterium antarcticum]